MQRKHLAGLPGGRPEGIAAENKEFNETAKIDSASPEGHMIRTQHQRIRSIIRLPELVEDITKRKTYEEKIRHQAFHDALTGLPNRLLFAERLREWVQGNRDRQRTTAVLFIDLDGFKRVNDEQGHDVGDRLLRDAAGRLARCVRGEETLARMGGDEFTMILPKIDRSVGTATSFEAQPQRSRLSLRRQERGGRLWFTACRTRRWRSSAAAP